jgi:hypothetical protein
MTADRPAGSPQFCPMCGGPLDDGNDFDESVTCRACGTLVSNDVRRPWFADPQGARQKVRPAAIALMVAGALFLVSGMAMPALMGVAFLSDDRPRHQGALVLAMLFGAIASITLGVGGTIIFGGYRMYHLRSWPLAIVSSIGAIGSIVSCCVFSFFGLLALPACPIGIWSLVVLLDPNVKASFASNRTLSDGREY